MEFWQWRGSVLRACQWCRFTMTRVPLKCEKLARDVVAFQRGFCLEKTNSRITSHARVENQKIMWIWSQRLYRCCTETTDSGFTCWPHCGLWVVNYIVTEVNLLGRTHTIEEKSLGVSSIAYIFPSNPVSYSLLFTPIRVSPLVALPLNSFDPLQMHFPRFRLGLSPSSKQPM